MVAFLNIFIVLKKWKEFNNIRRFKNIYFGVNLKTSSSTYLGTRTCLKVGDQKYKIMGVFI